MLCGAVCVYNIATDENSFYNCMNNENNYTLISILNSKYSKWYKLINTHIENIDDILSSFIEKRPTIIIYNFKNKLECMHTLMLIYKKYVQYYKHELELTLLPSDVLDIIIDYTYNNNLYNLNIWDKLIKEYS